MTSASFEIKCIEEATISAAMDGAIRECLCECFPDDATIFARQRAWHDSAPLFSLVGFESEIVVGHVGVVVRTVRVGDVQVEVAGIQNMAVRPRMRGTPLGASLVMGAMDEAARRGVRFGLLFCVPGLEKYYARFGWTLRPTEVRMDFEGERDIPIPGKNICMVKLLGDSTFPDGDIHLQGPDW